MMTSELLKASGCVYRSGYYTPKEFNELFGIDPLQYPHYFRITGTNLVVILPQFNIDCEIHFNQVRSNWYSLGV